MTTELASSLEALASEALASKALASKAPRLEPLAMATKGRAPDELMPPAGEGDAALASYIRVMRLKRLFRQGWLKRGVPEALCESVADHSFGTALLALLLERDHPPGIDTSRLVLLALVHELGESYAGDITPVDGVSREEKERRESEAIDKALEGHPDAAGLKALWEEFEAGASPEARYLRELDRLEMGLQAALYRAEGFPLMDEFFASARRSVADPRLSSMLEAAIARSGDELDG